MSLSLETLHLGVQCCEDDCTAEIVAGILLLYACKYPSKGLGKVRVGLDDSPLQLYNVLDEHFELLDTVVTTSTSDFCKTKFNCTATVSLHGLKGQHLMRYMEISRKTTMYTIVVDVITGITNAALQHTRFPFQNARRTTSARIVRFQLQSSGIMKASLTLAHQIIS